MANLGITCRDVVRAFLGVDAWEVSPDEVIAAIRRVSNPEWQNNLRRWIAATVTGENSRIPSDEQILEWLGEPELLAKVSAVVRRIPVSWMGEK